MIGVFACRSPVRHNPIGLTTAEISHGDHDRGWVEIVKIDAFDGTPILDLKAYTLCPNLKTLGLSPSLGRNMTNSDRYSGYTLHGTEHLCETQEARFSQLGQVGRRFTGVETEGQSSSP
jgi:hypothetical protein